MQQSPQPLVEIKGRHSNWIVNPGYDLMFFSTIWLPPLLILASIQFSKGMSAAFFSIWIYHLFVRLPHFAATIHVTYRRKEQRDYFRQHWIQYYVVPVFILAIYSLMLIKPPIYPDWLRSLLTTIASIWGFQHIAMQNFGILQLYNGRLTLKATRNAARLEKAIFYAIVVGLYVEGWVSQAVAWIDPGYGEKISGLPELVVNNLLAWLIAIELARRFMTRTFLSPATLYFLVSVVAMYRWSFYDQLPGGCWFFVFNGHHSIAYVGLVFLMRWNELHPQEPLTLSKAVFTYAQYLIPLILISLAALLATVAYSRFLNDNVVVDLWALTGIFVVHYYLESQVWRFSQRHNRETTLPLLRQPCNAAACATD